jgi:hypothetical protein
VKEEAMRVRKIQQRELFNDKSAAPMPVLQKEVRDELVQLLTQWLYTLGEQMIQEGCDE